MVSNESGNDENLGASDEETFKPLIKGGSSELDAEEISLLYKDVLNSNGTIELSDWQNPGRRPPTPDIIKEFKEEQDANDATMDTATEFDFQDEMSQLKLSVRQPGECQPKGSAKKATTSLNSILSNMARHRKLEMMEKDLD